jgi:hypothetical protein
MPDLSESLQGRDLAHLRIVAELWGIELQTPDARTALVRLVPILLDRYLVEEMISDLPGEVRVVLEDLGHNQGRLPWALFTRRYGQVREMGAGKRDRERPYLDPVSAAEMLWYRALIARAFFDTPSGPEEFAYIPDDLLDLIPSPQSNTIPSPVGYGSLGRAASSIERAHPILANDHILDHACTLLASLRLGIKRDIDFETHKDDGSGITNIPYPLSPIPLQAILVNAGLLDSKNVPLPEPTRSFLEMPRGDALVLLARAWLDSITFNDLRHIPGLSAEGDWQNDALRARQSILAFLEPIPAGTWWSLPAFISAIHERFPDFQRPSGDYDSWFIRDIPGGEFLRGFENWDKVDGELIRFVIAGPLHWLGILDLAAPAPQSTISAFRFSPWSEDLLHGKEPPGLPAEEGKILIRSDARLNAPRLAPRALRYQIARFCEWDKETPEAYTYRLTPESLKRAKKQGLTVQHLLTLLHRHTDLIPPSLIKALERWEKHGSEARIENLVVLRLSSPETLQALRASHAARYLGDPLGPTVVAIKPGATDKILATLAEMGVLGESRIEGGE